MGHRGRGRGARSAAGRTRPPGRWTPGVPEEHREAGTIRRRVSSGEDAATRRVGIETVPDPVRRPGQHAGVTGDGGSRPGSICAVRGQEPMRWHRRRERQSWRLVWRSISVDGGASEVDDDEAQLRGRLVAEFRPTAPSLTLWSGEEGWVYGWARSRMAASC